MLASDREAILLVAALLLACLAVPGSVLFLAMQSSRGGAWVRAVNLAILLLSSGIAFAYYFTHQDKFKTPADKVGFLFGVIGGPLGAAVVLEAALGWS